MNLIQTILAFLFALGPLIVIHELGHYAVARLCGVKVLRFSVGMGKVIWSRRFGPDQTEWAISALPLGGYVKMLDAREQGDESIAPTDLAREFTRQSVWRRIAIVAAGPIANFLMAIVLFAGLYMVGVEEPRTRVHAMAETTAAYRAGLRGGDLITGVNGHAIASWSELRWQLVTAALDKADATLDVKRGEGGELRLVMPAGAMAGLDPEGDILSALGLQMFWPRAVLAEVGEGGAAARAGLRAGDEIVAVDAKPVTEGPELIRAVRAAGLRPMRLSVLRAGRSFELTVSAEVDPKDKVARINARPEAPEMATMSTPPLQALGKATRKVWETSVMTVKMIGKMITGQVSLKNVTGPITIADYAGQTARMGASVYLGFIAFISISLGVMNLLPIPVLDGGLLLYYSLEVLTGRPLPERIGDVAQRIGLGLLVMLMALAVFNDVARLL
ncbi:MAG: RIP metalloprotease RseP [Pseudomonadota bacterium]